jgi:hypothetical protein
MRSWQATQIPTTNYWMPWPNNGSHSQKKQQQIQINRGVKPAPIDLARINYFRFLKERL